MAYSLLVGCFNGSSDVVVTTSIFFKKYTIMSFLNFLFGNKNSEFIKTINASTYKAAIAVKNVQLVDVRTPNEFSRGAIKKAINIDFFNSAAFENAFNKFKKDEPLYIYCQSGMRSKRAANKLSKMGFTDIIDLKGGYMAYK